MLHSAPVDHPPALPDTSAAAVDAFIARWDGTGDVVAVADRAGDFTGKPRPAVIVQSELFSDLDSIAVWPLTTISTDAVLPRLRLEPSATLPLRQVSFIEVDKLTTVRRRRVGPVIGMLSSEDMRRLNGALAVFLGLG